VGHTPSVSYAEYFVAMLYLYRRDVTVMQARTEAAMAFAEAQGFGLRYEQGRILRGWTLAMQGDAAEGVGQIRQGLAVYQSGGSRLGHPHHLGLLAEAYGQAGQPEAGLTVLAEALMRVAETDECWWEAELHRLQGILLLQRPTPETLRAEACSQQALTAGVGQQAKALELRAATSLSRLWQQQGKQDAARNLLAPIYNWFTEGFNTPDLQEAQALLTELS
jgi:predicted ATPase